MLVQGAVFLLKYTHSTTSIVQKLHFTNSIKKSFQKTRLKICTMGNMRKSGFTNSTEFGYKKKRSQFSILFKDAHIKLSLRTNFGFAGAESPYASRYFRFSL